MKIALDCFPCIMRQVVDCSQSLSQNPEERIEIARQLLSVFAQIDPQLPAPVIARLIHRKIREISGRDPYKADKKKQNELAQRLAFELEEKIKNATDPIEMAARYSIAANAIDLGVFSTIDEEYIKKGIIEAANSPLLGDISCFKEDICKADKILFIADNAGEIIFDRLLIEAIGPEKTVLCVRGMPVINDATLEDAVFAGLDKLVPIIDTGTDIPGIILSECSDNFIRHYRDCDLILAKGQGNFETLYDQPGKKYFLFKAKCNVISGLAKVPLGSFVINKNFR